MWYGMVRCDIIWYDLIWYVMIRYVMIWYNITWHYSTQLKYDMIWYDINWYELKIWYYRIWNNRKLYTIWKDVICYYIIKYYMIWCSGCPGTNGRNHPGGQIWTTPVLRLIHNTGEKEKNIHKIKVKLLITDPHLTSSTTLSKEKEEKNMYMLHLTCYTWQVTHDMWHMTCNTWFGVNTLLKFQLPLSYCLG